MGRKSVKPLEPPELLSDSDMQRFRDDPNFRAARRAEKLAVLVPPVGGTALRGFKRDWLFDGASEIPQPPDINPLLVDAIRSRVVMMRPLTDKITDRYDIYPNIKSAQKYGVTQNRKYASRVSNEVTDPIVLPNFQQGIERNLFHVRDNLQRNLWLKRTVSQWRQYYIETFLEQSGGEGDIDPEVVRHVGGAIADVGYCLRSGEGLGLLRYLGQDQSAAQSIEHIGQYIAMGHPETARANIELVELARVEQEKRITYWGERYDATYQAFGNLLPDQDLADQRDLDALLQHLYDPAEKVGE